MKTKIILPSLFTVCSIACVTSAARADILSGLVFHAELNGSFNDTSGNDFNGSNFGAISTMNRFGEADSAFLFDGTGDFASFSIPALPTGASSRSLSLWVRSEKIGQRSSNEHFAGYGSYPTNQAFGFFIGSNEAAGHNGRVVGYLGFDDVYTPYFVTNEWFHIAETYDGLVTKVYINGAFASERSSALHTQSDSTFILGARYATESSLAVLDFFDGAIDDVRIYNRALSASEVLVLQSIPEPATYALLLCSMTFFTATMHKRRVK